MMLDLLCIPACTILNRLRGHGPLDRALPGRALYWAAGVLGLLSGLLSGSWHLGLAWGLGYLAWGIPGWGAFTDLNRAAEDANPGRTERVIQWVVLNLLPSVWDLLFPTIEHAALFARHMLVLPCLVAVAWIAGLWWLPLLAPVFAAGTVLAYEAGYRLARSVGAGWAVGEYLTGALWGGLILLTL